MSSSHRRYLKIGVSLSLVAGLIYFLDTESLFAALKGIDLAWLTIAFAMVIGNRILMPLKWNLLLRARGIFLSWFDALRIYTIASFLGLALPPTVGADSVRSYYLRQSGIPLSDAIASIVIERAFGFAVLLAFTLAGFIVLINLLRAGDVQLAGIAIVLTAVTGALLAGLYLSFTGYFQRLAGAMASRLQGTRLDRIASGLDSLVRAYQNYRHRKSILAVFCALTALELTIVIVRSYVVALALGVDLALVVYFAFLPLVTLLNRLPISFDGFGINEALFIWFLGLFGVLAEKGFLIGLINHLLFIVAVLPGGLFYIYSDRSNEPPARSA